MNRFLLALLLLLLCQYPSQGAVTSWGYQLQNYDIDDLIDSTYDLLVIDYSKDGSEDERFSSAEITQIKQNGKTILSYISIGEAEDYRYYFDQDWLDTPPSWFDGENPDWEGNYKVKYWDENWQSIIFGYLDRIMDQGFDGVYLDIIDAYEFYENTVPDAANRMINFVITIANYTRTYHPGFLIYPQNGEALLNNDTYLQTVDGIGCEDVYILPDEQERRGEAEISVIEEDLNLLIDAQKTVLVVDYSDDSDLIEFARTSASSNGYIHYVGTLDLDTLLPPDYSGEDGFQYLLLLGVGTVVIIVGLLLFTRRRK